MALGVSSTMALILLFALVHCNALQAESATKASSSYRVVVPAKAQAAVEDAEGLIRLPSSVAEPDPDRSLVQPVAEPDPDRSPVENMAEPDPDRSLVEPVAEPDPDRSHPDSDELAATKKKPCSEGQQGDEKVKKEQIDGEDKEEVEDKEKAKKHQRQSDDADKEEENRKKKNIHRAEDESSVKKKTIKLSRHIKNSDDSDDDDDEEKMAKLWRKKAMKKRSGHGRRYQREEA